ncbi:hypothetical protein JCM17960_10740 [Magnetospira thiophila]
MARFVPLSTDADDWSRRIDGLADLNLLQTWAYGEAKAKTGPWRVERGLFEHTPGAVQVLLRPLPGGLPGGLAWINRGPMCDGGDPAPLLAALRAHYVDDRGFYLRIAPSAGEDFAPPSGFAGTDIPGWASARLDLTPDEATLRQGLKQKWRNGLNKAVKLGLEVTHGTDDAAYADFRAAHVAFLGDRGFDTSVTADFLDVWRTLETPRRQPVALLARLENQVVGAALMARYGTTWEYLAGNQTDEGRRLNAGQLLLWTAATLARADGARWLDLGGMDARLTPPGIFKFKQGLGGTAYRLAGEMEALPGGPLRGLAARLVRHKVTRARAAEGGAP